MRALGARHIGRAAIGLVLLVFGQRQAPACPTRSPPLPSPQALFGVESRPFSSVDVFNPIGHLPLHGNGGDGWAGWADIPRIEALRDAWFEAPDDAARERLRDDMQRSAMDELPSVPLGCFCSNTALRRDLADRVPGLSIFWNTRRG